MLTHSQTFFSSVDLSKQSLTGVSVFQLRFHKKILSSLHCNIKRLHVEIHHSKSEDMLIVHLVCVYYTDKEDLICI